MIACLTRALFGFDLDPKIKESIKFFGYEFAKVMILLLVMITIIGFIRTYIPSYKIKQWISRKKSLGNIYASFFGAITPFCSCSSIPLFLSFIKINIPLGVAFSFLITSPLVNEYLVALMLGFFGWKITLAYVISGIAIGVVLGIILGRMKLERYLIQDIISEDAQMEDRQYKGFLPRVKFGLDEAWSIIKKLWFWILIGVGLGALIHNYVPEDLVQKTTSSVGPWAVVIVVLLGIPMYGSCAAILPIAVVLFQKGLSLGTALAFMMAISALSLPEAVILRRAMKLQLIMTYFFIVGLGIIFTGYLFNYLQTILV